MTTRPCWDTSSGSRIRATCTTLASTTPRQHVYCIRDLKDGKQGRYAVMTPGDIVVHAFSFADHGGDPVVALSSPTHCRDLFVVEGPRQYRRLTEINPQMATWQMPQISVVSWTGANGDPVEGVLELPFDYDPANDGPLPMILELHGGPTAATTLGVRYWCYGRTIMPANGYALLSPNYRGSTGYGDKFMIELIGHENDIEVRDILAGVDALVDRGVADPERLGVMGWSNGGYLTNALITHSTRFKAASSGAGIADMLIQWSIEDTPGHVINYMQGLPWEQPDAYRKASPIWDFGRVRTPTLIHVGGADAARAGRTQPCDLSRLAQLLQRARDAAGLSRPGPWPGHVQDAQGQNGMGPGVVQTLHSR